MIQATSRQSIPKEWMDPIGPNVGYAKPEFREQVLELAKKGIPCALAEPGISDALTCGSRYWPHRAQWCGVLKGREADWQPSRWQAVQGVMAGSKKALDDAERTLGLSHWKKLYCEAGAGKSWEAALTQLAGRMGTQGRMPEERI